MGRPARQAFTAWCKSGYTIIVFVKKDATHH